MILPVIVVFVAALWRPTDADVYRYFAYTSAAVGRPFNSFYVRSYDTWQDDFIAGRLGRPNDFPIVVPARSLVPYRDFLVEYPPGFFLAVFPPALLTANETVYKLLFEAWMAALLLTALFCCVRIAPHLVTSMPPLELIAWGSVAALALGRVTVQRADALVALLVCVMCWAVFVRRPVVLGLAAGAATAVKLVPVLVAVLCGMYLVRDRRPREAVKAAAAFAAAAAAICVPVAMLAGVHGLLQVLQYHIDRPLEFESTAAAVLGVWNGVDPGSAALTYSYGSGNVIGTFARIASISSTAGAAAAFAIVYAGAWFAWDPERLHAERARVLVVSTTAVLAVVITLGKVGSLQYLVWLLPLGVLAALAAEDRVGLLLLLAAMAAAQLIWPVFAAAAEAMRPWPYAIVLARNLILLAWAARMFAREIARRPPRMPRPEAAVPAKQARRLPHAAGAISRRKAANSRAPVRD